ncbi:type II secretion system F family protein [Nocardiopsis tropica]|uniref:Type II secretion system F family protein n=1 Tax=Nocardiopsis tropica TaxID=109330 RepID=A0ABU7KMR6_9ACTN|nr:type II secretion system F family protein [Nocardiopsis umidischolae]MEE2050590.1 type II secretion system F family protein [Nocardiopsis umidischolae]
MDLLPLAFSSLFGLGITLLVAGLVPAHPDMRAVIAGASSTSHRPGDGEGWQSHLRVRLERLATSSLVRAPHQRLALARVSPARYTAYKLGGLVVGAAAPMLMSAVLLLVGIPVSLVVPAGFAVACAAVGFLLPDALVRQRADRAKAQVREAVTAYLTLTALSLRSGLGLDAALMEAARVADTWIWRTIYQALDHAVLARQPAWEGLRALSRQLDVPELVDIADIAMTGSEGTAVADALMARARSLRHQILAEQRGQANEINEKLVVPIALMGLTFLAMLFYPVISRLLTV